MNELVVNETGITDMPTGTNVQNTPSIIATQPLLTVITALLVERQGNGIVRLLVPIILDLRQLLKPLTSLLLRARAQTLIILERPSSSALTLSRTPPIQLTLRIE